MKISKSIEELEKMQLTTKGLSFMMALLPKLDGDPGFSEVTIADMAKTMNISINSAKCIFRLLCKRGAIRNLG